HLGPALERGGAPAPAQLDAHILREQRPRRVRREPDRVERHARRRHRWARPRRLDRGGRGTSGDLMRIVHRTAAVIMALAMNGAAVAVPTAAAASGPVTLEATYTSPSYGWTKVERWYDSNPGFIPAQYPADGRLDQTGQRLTFFGSARPAAGRFLLSYGPGW